MPKTLPYDPGYFVSSPLTRKVGEALTLEHTVYLVLPMIGTGSLSSSTILSPVHEHSASDFVTTKISRPLLLPEFVVRLILLPTLLPSETKGYTFQTS